MTASAAAPSGNRAPGSSVCAGMDTIRRPVAIGVALLTLGFLLAACSSGGAPSPAASQPAPDTPITAPPSDGDAGPSEEPSEDPVIAGAKPVVPKPGQLDVHQVPIDTLTARVDGTTVIVDPVWTSGVEPCHTLDHVEVTKGDGTMSIALYEGRGPEDVVCIAIAEQHTTRIEVPDVTAGTWTIVDAAGNAAPIEVTVG